MKRILTIATALVLSGCSIFGDPVAEKVADAVDKYCEEPFSARQLYRQTVNAKLDREGHSVQVQCFGDPEVQ